MKFCKKCQCDTERYSNGRCKPCQKISDATYRNANPDKAKKYAASYYVKNADKLKAYSTTYRETRPDKVKAYAAAWRKANPEKVKEKNEVRRKTNSVKLKEYQVAYYVKNRDKLKVCSTEWKNANSEKIKAQSAAYYAKNTVKLKEQSAAWSKNNPEAKIIARQNRRARKLAAGGTLSKGLSAKLFELQRGKCACCTLPLGDNYHLDHIMPLALGGNNTDSNIQLLTQTCNSQKHTKHPVDFMQSRGYLL